MPDWRRRHGKAGRSIGNRVSANLATRGCEQPCSNLRGCGCDISRTPALSRWFHERVSRNGGRFRKTMITALARKLLVALWKYVTAGVVIEGATIRTA